MNAGTTPLTELQGLDTPPAGEAFWSDLHAQLLTVAQAAGPSEGTAPVDAVAVTSLSRRAAISRRRPAAFVIALAAAAVVAVIVGIAAMGTGGGPDTLPGDVAVPEPTEGVVVTEREPAPPTTVGTAAVPLSRRLLQGDHGDDVRMVQQRLADLKFDPGPVDGVFGAYTTQAVWAFETLVLGTPRHEVTGILTQEMWAVMQGEVAIMPRRTELTSTHVEVYLPEQALVVFQDNVPALIAHISSGELAEPGDDFTKGKEWCQEVAISPGEIGNEDGTEPVIDGRCGVSLTPGGTYRAHRKVMGRRETPLGGMYDPVYFNYGIAVYGADNVPNLPASQGGIRINRWVASRFQSMIATVGKSTGDQIWVWNGVMEPEHYGPKAGIFDWPWLEWRDAQSADPPD